MPLAAVAQLICSAQDGLDSGQWKLTEKDRSAAGVLVGRLTRPDPAQLPQLPSLGERAIRLHEAAADLAMAAVTAEGEFAWTLSQCAKVLGRVLQDIDKHAVPRLRQPTPQELSDAEEALHRLHEFLLALRAQP